MRNERRIQNEGRAGRMRRREFLAGLGAAATLGPAFGPITSRAESQAPTQPARVASPGPPSVMVPLDQSWPGFREHGKHLVFARFAIPLHERGAAGVLPLRSSQ